MSENLTVTSDRVRQAAAMCPAAETVLKELFPDAFKSKEINLSLLEPTVARSCGELFTEKSTIAAVGKYKLIAIRNGGQYKNKAFWLYSGFQWEIKIDNSDGSKILIPTPD